MDSKYAAEVSLVDVTVSGKQNNITHPLDELSTMFCSVAFGEPVGVTLRWRRVRARGGVWLQAPSL